MENTNISRYLLSYDVKDSKKTNNETLRKELINFLLTDGAIYIKSYTDSCILFTSNNSIDYDLWVKNIGEIFSETIYFIFVEIAKRDVATSNDKIGSFKSTKKSDKKFEGDFDALVKLEQEKLK